MFTAVEFVADVMRQIIAFAGTINYAAIVDNCRNLVLQNEDIFLFMVSFILSAAIKIVIVTVHVIEKTIYTAKEAGSPDGLPVCFSLNKTNAHFRMHTR